MSRPSLLIVDDEPFNLEIIVEYLAERDYELVTAGDGASALALLAEDRERFDLVLLDRMMPGLDGMEVLRRIKADPVLQTIPVIMQTAAASAEDLREGLAAGAHYYLTKPFAAGALLAVVHTALQDRLRHSELARRVSEHAVAMQRVLRAEFSVRSLDDAAAVAVTASLVARKPETLAMGLAELLVNAVEHGNLGIDFAEKGRLKEEGRWSDEVARRLALPANRDKRVTLTLRREAEGWRFEILDEGLGFDWKRYLEPDPERAFALNGRGIALARQLAFDRIEYRGVGNELTAWVSEAREGA